MVQPLQFQQIQQPGLGAAANILGQQTNIVNQRSRNKTDLLGRLIGGGATIGAQVLQGRQAKELQKQKQPFQLLNAVDDLGKAADQARARGDDETADRLDNIVGGALQGFNQEGQLSPGGGILSKLGISTTGQGTVSDSEAQAVGGGGLSGQVSSGGLQPINAPSFPTSPSVGDKFQVDPVQGITPNLGPTTNLPLEDKRADVVRGRQEIAKNVQEIEKGQAEAFKANIEKDNLNSYQKVLALPDGTKFSGLGNKPFIGVRMNDDVRALVAQGQNELAIEPKKVNEIRNNLQDGVDFVTDTIKDFETIVQSGFIPKTAGVGEVTGRNLIGSPNRMISNVSGALAQKFAQDPKRISKVQGVERQIQGRLARLAKSLFGQSGALSEIELEQVATSMPSITALDQAQAEQQLEGFIDLVVPLMIDKAIKTGDARTENKLNLLYRKVTGNFYNPGGAAGVEEVGSTVSRNNEQARQLLEL